MLGLLGYGFLILRIVGVAVILATLMGAVVFHLGWRQEHPDTFWPLRSLIGFGGLMCVGAGLFLGSLLIAGLGVLAWIVGLLFRI
ncbi:MAG TPA: hypothetical protein VE967_11510 [Gemmatimonadaceae bacterium]|nr:hypothetical protein [Gemmatimonadaceae bacterium]